MTRIVLATLMRHGGTAGALSYTAGRRPRGSYVLRLPAHAMRDEMHRL